MRISSNKNPGADKVHLTAKTEAAVEVSVHEVKVKITMSVFMTVLAFGAIAAVVAILRILHGA